MEVRINADFFDDISGMTKRIKLLRQKAIAGFNTKKPWFGDELDVFDEPSVEKKPLIIRKALAFKKMLTEMPINIGEGELIVGNIPLGSVAGGRPFPKYANAQEIEEAAQKSLSIKSVWGHIVPDYPKVLTQGLKGLKEEVSRYLKKAKSAQQQEKMEFYEANLICCDAVLALADRYGDLAQELSLKESRAQQKKELEKLSDICRKVPYLQPESFHEAVQSFYFVFIALHSTLNFVPLGRFDQYMIDFLVRDLNEEIITIKKVQEIIDCLWIKLNERTQKNPELLEDRSDPYDWSTGRNPKDGTLFGQNEDIAYYNQWYQTCVLGGKKEDGSDATNLLTYMCLEASNKLKMTQPVLYARLHQDSPPEFLDKCCELIKNGLSMPTIINDEIRIPALEKMGVPLSDANNYALAGCWETIIPEKTEFRWTPVHTLKALEYVLNRGYDQLLNKQVGPDTGDPLIFSTFKDFNEAFKAQLEVLLQKAIQTVLEYYGEMYKIAPVPFLSALIDDCLSKGKDLTQGGARYIFHALSLTGLANTIDSLVTVKTLVFEEKQLKMEDLINAVNSNFDECEEIRLFIKNRIPKFGNDLDVTDQFLEYIVAFFTEKVAELAPKNDNNILFPCMIGTTPMYKLFGRAHIASADGRKAREPIAANLCPTEGVAKKGLTAIIKSHTKCNWIDIPMGSELDIHVRKKSIESAEGIKRLKAAIKSFLDLGGPGLNITVTDQETLIAAQKEPEKYQDLMVRLGGWQAYFVALDRVHQDQIIMRDKFE